MRLRRRKPARDGWADLRAEVERDSAAFLADGWSRPDVIVLVTDRVRDRLQVELTEGIVAAAIQHELRTRL